MKSLIVTIQVVDGSESAVVSSAMGASQFLAVFEARLRRRDRKPVGYWRAGTAIRKRQSTGALQDAGANSNAHSSTRSVMECAGALALFACK
jgi:hypothetical protein